MAVSHSSQKKEMNYEQEFQLYLSDAYHWECPLDFWRIKSMEYPTLASLAHQVFSVPASVECVLARLEDFKSPATSYDSKEL